MTTLTVGVPTSDGDVVMRNAITAELMLQFNAMHPRDIADHIMYCLPPGTMRIIAYGYINSWLTVFQDNWCTYVSSQVHEIGHNLNLHHSNENGEYKDQSGMVSLWMESI